MERWFGSTRVGDDSRDVSGVEMLEELDKAGELSESSYDPVEEDAELSIGCRSGALNARTFVVERSSTGKEIWARSKEFPHFFVLTARLGKEGATAFSRFL